jgi:hypothetical protein
VVSGGAVCGDGGRNVLFIKLNVALTSRGKRASFGGTVDSHLSTQMYSISGENASGILLRGRFGERNGPRRFGLRL